MKTLSVLDLCICLDPMPSTLSNRLSPEDLQIYTSLLEKAQLFPYSAFDEVKSFQERHPQLPEALNLLTYVYLKRRDVQKAEQLIQENFKQNPDYLFARINYADLCVRKKEFEKIPEIFPSFNLKVLYPEKEVFHVTEFRGFMVTLGFYHQAMNKKKESQDCLDLAKKVDPDHESVKLLEKKLRPNLLKRLLRLKK